MRVRWHLAMCRDVPGASRSSSASCARRCGATGNERSRANIASWSSSINGAVRRLDARAGHRRRSRARPGPRRQAHRRRAQRRDRSQEPLRASRRVVRAIAWRSSPRSAAADHVAPGVKSRHERACTNLRPWPIRWSSPARPTGRACWSGPASTATSRRRAKPSSRRGRRSSRSRSGAPTSGRTPTRRRCWTRCRRPNSPTSRTAPAATPPTTRCERSSSRASCWTATR